MNSEFFAFFCTSPAGWESDDYMLVSLPLVGLALLLLINKYWLSRRTKNKWATVLRKTVVWGGATVLILIAAVYTWLAPC